MNTNELLNLLQQHSTKSLLFEYTKDSFVGANYHITEVKNVAIDSVDCGSGTDFWKETVIQLWESPQEKNKKEFMTAEKALKILKQVHRMRPMDLTAVVKFEYSNSSFHTAQLFVSDYSLNNSQLVIKLAVNETDCKAKEACAPVQQENQQSACCEPASNCC